MIGLVLHVSASTRWRRRLFNVQVRGYVLLLVYHYLTKTTILSKEAYLHYSIRALNARRWSMPATPPQQQTFNASQLHQYESDSRSD